MVGAGRGGPRHAEQRAGRAAPSIHARPGREEAAASAGTAGRGRPARALARAAPRAGGAAGRRGGGGGVGGNGSSEPVGAAARQAGGRSARVSEGHWNAELSVTGSSAYSGARPLPCSAGSARSRRPAAAGRGAGTPGEGRAEGRGEREAGRAGFCGSVASRAAPAPGPQPGRTGQCARPLPTRADSRRPPPRPPPFRPPPSPQPDTLPPPPAPPPARPARTGAEAARCHLGGGGDERPGPPSQAADCAPDFRARVRATGDAAGVGHRGPGPPGDGVRGSHAHLPRSVLACRTGRASTRGLAAAPRRPGVPPRTRIPGAFVASRQEGPEHSGETIVSGQTASGRTWSLAVTREGTRQSQAGGAGGARGCPVGSGFFSKNSIERTGCKPAKAGRAAACDGGLESCSCLSGHRGERPGPMAAAFGEQDLDAPLTGEEAVQACGEPGPDGHWVSCHFRWPSSLGWKRTGRRSGQPVADAFGMSRRGHACFQEPAVSWRPSSGKRRPGALSPPRRAAAAQTEAPSTPCPGLPGEAGRPSGDAARSRARGRRGGAVACAAAA
ncbi:collagen alpha-1(I) chain-like [Cervus elaphus]|uniref:collagen alpha-1(I) chain-like n=1 Tax=Cervus elaphus TaxID=9860 RepID=UPI001CC2C297|nr:collagen alpha-1(I) chain-like [Cervus elaphus]